MAPNNHQYTPAGEPGPEITSSELYSKTGARKFLAEDEEEGINIREFLVKCVHVWKWFVISVIVFLGLGAFYVLYTPKKYTRMAEVMVKDEDSGSSNISSALSELGIGQTSANVANEVLAFQSPELVGQVVDRLGLRTEYTVRPRLRKKMLYGDSVIIAAKFPGLPIEKGMDMKIRLHGNGKVSVSDLCSGKDRYREVIDVTLGDTITTPLGSFVLTPGPAYKSDYEHTINVSHSPRTSAVSAYMNKYTAELPDDDATVIKFTMTDTDVPLITDFLNTLIKIYTEEWKEDKEQMAVATSNFINERLAVIEKELGSVDSDIAHFKGENLMPDVAEATKIFMKDANENTKSQVEVGTQIAITQYLVDYLKAPENADKLLPANTGVESQGIQSQIDDYNKQILKRNRIIAASGVNSPLVQEIDESLADIKSAMIASLANLKKALNTELSSLERSDRETNRKIASSPTQAKYLLSVERQQKVKEALYLFLLQQREENELSLAFTPSNLRMITPPWGELNPSAPKTRNIMLVCFIVGLLVPALIVFLNETLNTSVRSRNDLEMMRVPFLGEIPEADVKGGRLARWNRKWRSMTGKASKMEDTPTLYVRSHGRTVINESFRMLRSNIEFITRGGTTARVMMVTSFNPGSGKSFISLNLAAAFAVKKKDVRVLVIDLDLRRASVSRVVGSPSRGISDYLSEAVVDVASLIRPTDCAGLSILPVGTIPPNPSELLYSSRLQELISALRQDYDYIFLDCPPSEIVADTTIVAPLTDATIFVLRAGLMDRRLVPDLNLYYDTHRYNNLMAVLNGTTTAGAPYRHYAYSNYYSSTKE